MSFLNIVKNLTRSGRMPACRSANMMRTSATNNSNNRLVGGVRFMGGGAGGKSWNGFTPPHVAPIHKNMGTTMMVVMWLWLFYRAKEDGMSVLGLREPWEHGGSHGATVNTDNIKFKVTGVGEIPVLDTEDDHHH